jgi:calcium/calmodulin-dependent protein kinase kinase 2
MVARSQRGPNPKAQMKAISKFKGLLAPKDNHQSRTGAGPADSGPVTPRGASIKDLQHQRSHSTQRSTDQHVEELLRQRQQVRGATSSGDKGHAHDLTETEPMFLGIGAGGHDDFGNATREQGIVADSPTAVDFNVYDRAFEAEVDRIKRSSSKRKPTGNMFLTRHVKQKDQFKEDKAIVNESNKIGDDAKKDEKEEGKGRNLASVVAMAAKDLV